MHLPRTCMILSSRACSSKAPTAEAVVGETFRDVYSYGRMFLTLLEMARPRFWFLACCLAESFMWEDYGVNVSTFLHSASVWAATEYLIS